MTTPTIPASPTGTPSTTGATAGSTNLGNIAGNFNAFLTLLTTQLQHQDPLSPLDTNQFTQQLVQFASVEQQINMNTSLSTLISLQQTAQATAALNFIGATVVVGGSTAQLANGQASWNFAVASPARISPAPNGARTLGADSRSGSAANSRRTKRESSVARCTIMSASALARALGAVIPLGLQLTENSHILLV